ncbi:hypothetical protein KCU71_g70, partial [Aureobasidium melanogenum]
MSLLCLGSQTSLLCELTVVLKLVPQVAMLDLWSREPEERSLNLCTIGLHQRVRLDVENASGAACFARRVFDECKG